jgi:hypothetical protein
MGGIVPPANGCCCNMYASTNSRSACNVCCGPPVFFAVRMLCIVNLVGLVLHTGNTGWSVTSDDCCLAITKETTLISTGIGAIGKGARVRSGSAVWRGFVHPFPECALWFCSEGPEHQLNRPRDLLLRNGRVRASGDRAVVVRHDRPVAAAARHLPAALPDILLLGEWRPHQVSAPARQRS